jgi:hypothetical protein
MICGRVEPAPADGEELLRQIARAYSGAVDLAQVLERDRIGREAGSRGSAYSPGSR